MQLSKIKISGFKSFVDPTTISLPSKLVAIVGPNGCGKSNIIDAVTWVMGESSPKYLRGESLTDVIFNGSSARKPIGQASVELIFDNSDGSIGGEYASYAEISVKRMINRESDSSYYLNGVRCRKRDVVGIFLGTGLGPRSYSIVGQNMISRIIEAKPDDLRIYLEEAAGISKYKERRRETELRMKQTEENLARINDVRMELEKQLSHLKYQAGVAEKYKTLKGQERTLRAELHGVQWRELDCNMVDYTLQIQREGTALEARNSELSAVDREMEALRHEQRVASDAYQEVQRQYYAVGNDITRIEQDVLHHQERQHQWELDLQQAENDGTMLKAQMGEAEDSERGIEREIEELEPLLVAAHDMAEAQQAALEAAEAAMQDWQTEWDDFNQTTAKTTQTAQVEQTHIQHLEQALASMGKRQQQLQQDQIGLNFSELNEEIEVFSRKTHEVSDQMQVQTRALAEVRQSLTALQTQQHESTTRLDAVRSEAQQLRGQQASLQALQQTALGQRDNPAAPWLSKHQLETKPRLAQNIQVEKGWELAVEKVLGFCLQAICLEELGTFAAEVNDLTSGNLCMVAAKVPAMAAGATLASKGTLLLDKVTSPWSLESLLAGVYAADSLEQALALTASLTPYESVVTRDGLWLNRSWLKVLREDNPAAGVFQREQELKILAARIDSLNLVQEELEHNIETRTEEMHQLLQQRDDLQQLCHQLQAQAAQVSAQQKMKQERLGELTTQSERLVRELADCTEQLTQSKAELTQARECWQQAMTALETQAQTREQLQSDRLDAHHHLQWARDAVDKQKESIHALQMRMQTAKSQQGSLAQQRGRLQVQLTSLNERQLTLEKELSQMPPMEALKQALSAALDRHVSMESDLNHARVAVASLEQESLHLDERRQVALRDINQVRTRLEALRLEWQGWKVKSDAILEQIKETEWSLEEILKNLPSDISVEAWQGKLDQTLQRIHRLGAINLVAIDEYATCLERKEYLDAQMQDLESGLMTLNEAIAKIDKETRARFKETFEKVNERFQALFPTIFGGGKAYLELNSDDLLEAGVTMMACPPGKRNSSIYLLSGGEKSLTAIALIFSIFHLNPAPFCLLDEVDAALDDANVVRFTRLVQLMAEKTQFFFISHNKITIEMGEHLIGVTMNEPGVSRLVSVDIEKAISLAGA